MKICFVHNYPPGRDHAANQIYWLARALGEKGVEVHIITDVLEKEYFNGKEVDFENSDNLSRYQPPNVFVHSLNDRGRKRSCDCEDHWLTFQRMVNLAAELAQRPNFDLIDAGYFPPYHIVAWAMKFVAKCPLVFRYFDEDQDVIGLRRPRNPVLNAAKSADTLIVPEANLAEFKNWAWQAGIDPLLVCAPTTTLNRGFFESNPLEFSGLPKDENFNKWVEENLEIYKKTLEKFKAFPNFLNEIRETIKRFMYNFHD